LEQERRLGNGYPVRHIADGIGEYGWEYNESNVDATNKALEKDVHPGMPALGQSGPHR
jgi:hypothetical protein